MVAIGDILGATDGTVRHHLKMAGLYKKTKKSYDWTDIQRVYDDGMKPADIRRTMGVSKSAWFDAKKSGRIKSSSPRTNFAKSLELYALENMGVATRGVRFKLKERMLKAGTPYECALCGINSWRGQKLDLRLDHIDGDSGNHHPSNLRLICHNCDSQLPTFSHRNVGRKSSVTVRDDGRLWTKRQ